MALGAGWRSCPAAGPGRQGGSPGVVLGSSAGPCIARWAPSFCWDHLPLQRLCKLLHILGFAGGCQGLPWCPGLWAAIPPGQGSGEHPLKTRVSTSVMLLLRCPDGKHGHLSAGMRNSCSRDQQSSKSDVNQVQRALPSCLLSPSPGGVITGASSHGKESPSAWSEVWAKTAAEQTQSPFSPEMRGLAVSGSLCGC